MALLNRDQEIRRRVGWMVFAGISMLVIAFFLPDAGHQRGAFLTVATSSSWQKPFDWPAARCSVKIVLLAGLLFLGVDALLAILLRLKLEKLAFLVFCVEVLPVLGILIGVYYLLKALL